jgi:riboflavin biosynthesis pyrimidine reductase
VVSRSGELPARLFEDVDQPPILITCAESEQWSGLTSDQRRRVLVTGEESVDVKQAVALLAGHGMHRILCEGGPTLLDELVEAGAVDEICVTLAPKLAASQPVGSRRQPSGLSVPVDMQLGHALMHEDYLFLKYHRCEFG